MAAAESPHRGNPWRGVHTGVGLCHNGESAMSSSDRTIDALTVAGTYAGYASYVSLWRDSAWRFI